MSTSVFGPHIVKPTRVIHPTAPLIHNIFFNSIDFHTVSGNVVYDLSDHLPNFLIINGRLFNYQRTKALYETSLG